MIGLPRETHAEVQAIVDFGFRAREIGRARSRNGGRFTVHVSASNFVPKPHTPFQWEGMSPPEQLRVKQRVTCAGPCNGRQLRLSLHDTRTSMLEGALGRGDAVTGDVIETAWRAGARFDAWTEHHRRAGLARGLRGARARDSSTRQRVEREALEPLPWDHVRSGVTKEFLLDEWWADPRRARDGRLPLGRVHRLRRLHGPRPKPAGVLIRHLAALAA